MIASGTVMAYRMTTSKTQAETDTTSTTRTESSTPKPEKTESEKKQTETPQEPAPAPVAATIPPPSTSPRPVTPTPTPTPQTPSQQPLKVFKVNLYSVPTYCDHNTHGPAMNMTSVSGLLLGNSGGTVSWVVEALVSGQVVAGPSGSIAIASGQSSFSIPESLTQFTRTNIRSGDAMRLRVTSPNAVDTGWVYASVPICSF